MKKVGRILLQAPAPGFCKVARVLVLPHSKTVYAVECVRESRVLADATYFNCGELIDTLLNRMGPAPNLRSALRRAAEQGHNHAVERLLEEPLTQSALLSAVECAHKNGHRHTLELLFADKRFE